MDGKNKNCDLLKNSNVDEKLQPRHPNAYVKAPLKIGMQTCIFITFLKSPKILN
jgi:hypothetical protein